MHDTKESTPTYPTALTCTKRYDDIPFAHRQHTHEGHCRFIHGHNWSFEFVFGAHTCDACGFIVDFGKLGWLKEYLVRTFDHKLVLNDSDPALPFLTHMLSSKDAAEVWDVQSLAPFADITVVSDASCEGLAACLFGRVNAMLHLRTEGRVFLVAITVHEDSHNSATCRRT